MGSSFPLGHRIVAFQGCNNVANTCPTCCCPVPRANPIPSLSFQKPPYLGQGTGRQGCPSPVGQPVVTKESPESHSGLASAQRNRAWIMIQVVGSTSPSILCAGSRPFRAATLSGLMLGMQMSFQMPGTLCKKQNQGLEKNGAI